MSDSLYEKYGGFGQINKIVMAFYDELLDSEDIGPYFDDVDMSRLIDHQTKFVASLMGGPASFTEEQINNAHRTLSITDDHFDEMKAILNRTLESHGVSSEDAEQVTAEIDAYRPMIVARTG